MCGIAGHVGTRELASGRIQACMDLMRRRGPDHQAFWTWVGPYGRRVTLLHSRLSIIDLNARANQPFRVGKKTMVFNGELYNYVELRRDLEKAGERFDTTSDTEVLLTLVDRHGWTALDRCEGMWALAVYDESDGSLALCRDRFGEKPLYLYRDGGDLYFGSEVKFLAALLGRTPAVDLDQVRRYLVNGYKALYKGPATFFRGVAELPAASLLRLDAGGREELSRYWRPPSDPEEEMGFEEAVRGARERLSRAVEIRLRADVPLAFCMSGGVDSNALIALAWRALGYDVHGFTIQNTDPRFDERDLVERAVGDLGIRHTSVPLDTRGFLEDMRTLVRHHDAPVYTITYFTHWRLMSSVAGHGYRVSVSGTGADELFTGYYDHHLAYLYEVRGDPELHARSLAAWREHILPLVRNPLLRDPELFLRDPAARAHVYLDQEAFASCLCHPWREPFREETYSASLLRNRMMNELFHEVVPPILHEDDLNAMYFSIENRSPFLDRPLFEFCQRIPARHLVRDGFSKAVLREAVRGMAPESVLSSRRKVGFNSPIFSLLDARDPAVRAELLRESPILALVRREEVARLLDAAHLDDSWSKFLFYYVSARIFLEEFGGA